MRISDWSSDVCSSDLGAGDHRRGAARRRAGTAPAPRRDPACGGAGVMLRGGLIGCGFFAANQLHAWRDQAGAEIVAICDTDPARLAATGERSEEHTSELQSLMRISYAVFCLKKKKKITKKITNKK